MSFVGVAVLMILLVILELGIVSPGDGPHPRETLPAILTDRHIEEMPTQEGKAQKSSHSRASDWGRAEERPLGPPPVWNRP